MATTLNDDGRYEMARLKPVRITSRTTLKEIRTLLERDGYAHVDEKAVKRAAVAGALIWTAKHLITTDSSRIHALPECWTR